MKAVNLIPPGERRGAGGVAGRSGGAAYVLLGALVLVVVAVASLALTAKDVDDKEAQLAGLQQQVATANARTAELERFAAFASLRERRVATVRSLAQSRFDWGAALHEVSRVVPKNVWLTTLNATVAPGVNTGGAGGNTLRAALATPAIELTGCTTSQPGVARAMAAFRRIEGVQRVSLATSEKAAAAAGGAGGGGDCRQGRSGFPQFSMVVFFDNPAGAAAATTPGATPTGLTGPSGPSGPSGAAPASTQEPTP